MAAVLNTSDLLNRFMDQSLRRPWVWGGGPGGFDGEDCTLFAANWALALCGTDVADGIRGTYSTEDEALAIVERFGGAVAFVGGRLAGAGWEEADGRMDGDIAIARAPMAPLGVMGDIPVIRYGGLWTGRTMRGIKAANYAVTAAWRYSR